MNDIVKPYADLFSQSKLNGLVVKIWLSERENLVVAVIKFDSTAIIVEPYTLYGVEIFPVRIPLSEIIRATLFQIKYNDPVYVQIREARILADQLGAKRQALSANTISR